MKMTYYDPRKVIKNGKFIWSSTVDLAKLAEEMPQIEGDRILLGVRLDGQRAIAQEIDTESAYENFKASYTNHYQRWLIEYALFSLPRNMAEECTLSGREIIVLDQKTCELLPENMIDFSLRRQMTEWENGRKEDLIRRTYSTNVMNIGEVEEFFRELGYEVEYPPRKPAAIRMDPDIVKFKVRGFDPHNLEGRILKRWQELPIG